jgi:DNA integrity scanning protein DisA with diadenylate cyclase activity
MTATLPLLHQGMTTTMTTHPKERRLIKTTPLITLASLIIQMLICYQFHLGNHHTLMEKTILSGVIKCIVIYFSLHPSIWEIVENGMHFDNTDNPVFINEQIHKNAQATTVLLASLSRDEYNKVSGLDNANWWKASWGGSR